ncbi:MAG: hypothetical protein LH632_19970 [Rhodoferax sp.]|nr:hypothetical protein [Rhodoferax sp.]
MKRLRVALLALLVLLPVVAAALVWFAVDSVPLVTAKVVLTVTDIERAKQVLSRNDPRKMRQGVLRSVVLPQQDVSLAAAYLASRYANGSAQVLLQQGTATVRATMELPPNPLGRYLNLHAELEESGQLPRFAQLRIGRVPVPAFAGNWFLQRGFDRLQRHEGYSAAVDVVKQVQMREGALNVQFEWSDAAAAQIKSALVPAQDQERWKAYQARLVELAGAGGRVAPLPMEQLLAALLQLARQRSAAGDAVAENRAALIVLAFYANGKGLAALVPAARDWARPVQRVVTLGGRPDFSQHFSISAALAATAGSPLSDAVGLYKEVDDSRGGSGFSFNDIAADRAGTRLGEFATAAAGSAARLHLKAAAGLREQDLFPQVQDLPEFMPEPEFKRRFGGIGQPAYTRMMADIERRIAALPLYR